MRILHTSDWHVGKVLKGRSRHDEHAAVLGEIVDVCRAEHADLVLVAGDLFESIAPPADAQALVWETLLGFRHVGAEVVVVAGNHDHHAELDALAPLLGELGITLLADIAAPREGGVVEVTSGDGTRAQVALLPFLSQRQVVRAADILAADAAAGAASYGDRVRAIVAALTADFGPKTVNLVLAHAYVRGAKAAGGERQAQIESDYAVDAVAFPVAAQYVALGHLHATQRIPGPCPIWYCGAPIQVDFGEERDVKNVLLVDVEPGSPARARPVPLRSGRRLRTVSGTIEELRRIAGTTGSDYLLVVVREAARAGLGDEVAELMGSETMEVRLDPPERADPVPTARVTAERSPRELFGSYLTLRGVSDGRIDELFAKLLDEELSPAAQGG